MPTRICYVHIGPPKTGTSAIQQFLKENRASLIEQGYLVPEGGQSRGGAHFALVHQLCGEDVHPRHQLALESFAQELAESRCEAVIISSEALTGILMYPILAKKFFGNLTDLKLEPRIVMFPRNQPQLLNSGYGQVVKSFRWQYTLDKYFARAQYGRDAWRPKLELASANGIRIIARPYTSASAHNVVPDFLAAIGLDGPALTQNERGRINESVGPFTIGVAQGVQATINGGIKLRQAARCMKLMESYLSTHGLTDSGYCGLTTEMARQIEAECRENNDIFSIEVWGRPWNEVFATDVGLEFTANDYTIAGVPDAVKSKLKRAIGVLAKRAAIVMSRPKFASDAAWNDPRRFSQYQQTAAD